MSMKLLHIVLIAGTGLFLAADKPSQDAVRKDRELMAGTWITISGERDGASITVPRSQRLIVRPDGKIRLEREGDLVGGATTTIDPSVTPKAIDIDVTEGTMQGEKYKGIYEVSKDTLKICRSGDRGERPSGFSTKAGTGERMGVFKRAPK
jgi:uncharacterized protein (TIGR03067 family)